MTLTQTNTTLTALKQIASHTILSIVSLFLPVAGLVPAMAVAASAPKVIDLTWDDPNPESDVVGYKVYLGSESGVYNQTLDTGNSSQVSFTNLTPGEKYYVAVTAYNVSGVESDKSAEFAFIAAATDTTFNVKNVKVEKTDSPTGEHNITMTVDGQLGIATELRVEASNDMITWETISVHPNESAVITFDDPGSVGQPKRFYRFVENF